MELECQRWHEHRAVLNLRGDRVESTTWSLNRGAEDGFRGSKAKQNSAEGGSEGAVRLLRASEQLRARSCARCQGLSVTEWESPYATQQIGA